MNLQSVSVGSPRILPPSWIIENSEGIVIRLKIQARASQTQVVGEFGEAKDRLRIRIAAPPVDQAANEELLGFLKKKLGIPLSQLTLIRGHLNPLKDVLCLGTSVEKIQKALLSP